jgi:amidohydrolase
MTKKELETIIKLRKTLHQHPEVSGQEENTARLIKEFLADYHPDEVIDNLGGHGIAFRYKGENPGPTSLIRCELDGLPISEKSSEKHASTKDGVSHTCGHDGHMAIVAGVGMQLSRERPTKGDVVLLFQPAEETGEGAEKVIASKNFSRIQPDYAFALHNLPGYPENQVIIKKGAFAAASKGMIVKLTGKTSHAAHPEAGNSPTEALSKIMVALERLPDAMKKFTLITVIHAKLGEISFGTTPGEATLMATLRAYEDEVMEQLTTYSEKLIHHIAKDYKLQVDISYTESFAATENDPQAHQKVKEASKKLNLKTKNIRIPFRWSEDFGHFSKVSKSALFGLGAGKKQPQLHEPTYDFPDEILSTGINTFLEIINEIHN